MYLSLHVHVCVCIFGCMYVFVSVQSFLNKSPSTDMVVNWLMDWLPLIVTLIVG